MVLASTELNFWSWPSKMHNIEYNRSQLREYWTIGLSIITKLIVRDKSDWANVVLGLISNFTSSVLLFLICENFLSETHSFLISAFYVTLMWPYYITMYIGHILLAQTFFLASILLFLNATESLESIFLFLSGVSIAISFFSSSASRKYPYLFVVIISIFLAKEAKLNIPDADQIVLIVGCIIVAITLLFKFLKNFSTDLILKIFKIHDDHKKTISNLLSKLFIFIPIVVSVFVIGSIYYQEITLKFLIICLGSILIFFHIFMPLKTFLPNFKRYAIWLNVSNWASHFNAYPNPKETFGTILPKDFKGGGISWLHKLLIRMIPELYFTYGIAILIIAFNPLLNLINLDIIDLFIVVFISILSPFVHYSTGGLRVGKAMFSVVLPMLIPIAVVLHASPQYEVFVISILILQCIRTIILLHTHIIPCRMAPTVLRDKLKQLGVNTFYTYKTSFNDSFVSTMIYSFPNEFNVKYIKKMSEIKTGYLVVPQTSAKSVSMETQQEAILNGDFNTDKKLNDLIKSKEISKLALVRIPTIGNSKYFAQESEVTSYLDLMLKRVSDFDLYRGNAWILKIN